MTRPNERKAVWVRHHAAREALQQLGSIFDTAAIPWMPVKGVVLAQQLYTDPTDRDYGDVDVLVPRRHFAHAVRVLTERGAGLTYFSRELGEIAFEMSGVPLEIHAEVGRRDLTGLAVQHFFERSTLSSDAFGFPVCRIDDVDHVILLAANVVKDWFVQHRPHHAEDLGRLLARLERREHEIVARASAGGFRTGMFNVARWLVHCKHDGRAVPLLDSLGSASRQLQPFLASVSARYPTTVLNFAVASLTNDDCLVRLRAFERIVRRGAWRLLVTMVQGHSPRWKRRPPDP